MRGLVLVLAIVAGGCGGEEPAADREEQPPESDPCESCEPVDCAERCHRATTCDDSTVPHEDCMAECADRPGPKLCAPVGREWFDCSDPLLSCG